MKALSVMQKVYSNRALQDPDKFCESVEAEQQELRDKLIAATARLDKVTLSRELRLKISEVCSLPCWLPAVLPARHPHSILCLDIEKVPAFSAGTAAPVPDASARCTGCQVLAGSYNGIL